MAMDFYLGGIGIALFTASLQEAKKLELNIEDNTIQGICKEMFEYYRWNEYDPRRSKGIAISILGSLYGPEEYKAKNIARIHHEIATKMLKGQTENLPSPPPPAPVTRVSGTREVHLRILPLFLYGNVIEAKRIFEHPLPADIIATILEANLEIDRQQSELHVYKHPIDFDYVVSWKNETIKQLLRMS